MTAFRAAISFLVVASGLLPPASAQTAFADTVDAPLRQSRVEFSLPSQPLDQCLSDFASQAKLTLVVESQILNDLYCRPILGFYRIEKALDRLLARTGLNYELNNDIGVLRIVAGDADLNSKTMPAQVAQNDEYLEEVIVPGVFASLERSINIKRYTNGIVDAISAVDVRKFPDRNLAEALQRVTGVSVDRSNNEGNKVTVRGLGPDFNVITLNGRQMPVTGYPEILDLNSLAPASRSFEFINLVSDGVAAVKVYKTSSAQKTAGGIGATIDLVGFRPLVINEDQAVFTLKGVEDGSSKDNSQTPEVGAYVNKLMRDGTLGFYAAMTYQDRNSRLQQASTNGWINEQTALSDWYQNPIYSVDIDVQENVNIFQDQQTWFPASLFFSDADVDRVRVNNELVLQLALSDNVVSTIDWSQKTIKNDVTSTSFGSDFFGLYNDQQFGEDLSVSINKNGTAEQLVKDDGLYRYQNSRSRTNSETEMLGWNLAWSINESLFVTLDIAKSNAVSNRYTDRLSSVDLVAQSVQYDANFEIPALSVDYEQPYNGANLTTLIEPQTYSTFQQQMQNDLAQWQLNFEWLDVISGLDMLFGLEQKNNHLKSTVYTRPFVTTWQFDLVSSPNRDYLSELFEDRSFNHFLNEFSGGLNSSETFFVTDFQSPEAVTELRSESEDFKCYCDEPLALHEFEERIRSVYATLSYEQAFNLGTLIVSGGLRYEDVSTTESSVEDVPMSTVWQNAETLRIRYAEERRSIINDGGYGNLLPNLDISFEFPHQLVSRLSLSKSVARPDILQARGQTTLLTYLNQQNIARKGNAELSPYSSNNFDMSLEWYFNEGYLSLGYFQKNIENFTGVTTTIGPLFDIRDVAKGPRSLQAQAQLQAEGIPLTNANILNRIIANQGGDPFVESNAQDPLVDWRIETVVASESAQLSGWELAAQWRFGQSGFGSAMNYTVVESDRVYPERALGFQSAIPGLSDTFNFILFYEKNRLQARIAYNWRDEFLSSISTLTGPSPQYTEAYAQFDANFTLSLTDRFTLSFEGTNLTGENQRVYSRYTEQFMNAQAFDPIYVLGLRYALD